MRVKTLNFLRVHPKILNILWKLAHVFFMVIGVFVPVREKSMLIMSFAGRKYDDSPKALYEEILKRNEFNDWDIIWVFVNPDQFEIPRGRKIQVDTWSFFMALLYCKVWISNTAMDRNIGINRKKTIKVETWHGAPLKKIGIDQIGGALGNHKPNKKVDNRTIRCAQSEYDRDIFVRIFNASKECFIMAGLPRNDGLLQYSAEIIEEIKLTLGIPKNKRILLYMPTYRDYLVDKKNEMFLAPPMDLNKWRTELGTEYVLLLRMHYIYSKALNLKENDFIRDVSGYPCLNDLYAVADILISDYSSAYIDYSILDKPMLCFAYDEQEYKEKRGLYLDLRVALPCSVDKDEDTVITRIKNMDFEKESRATHKFHMKYAPTVGRASEAVVDKIIERLL